MKTPSKQLLEVWDMCITISWQVEIPHKLQLIQEELGPEPDGIPYDQLETWEINFIYAKMMMTAWMYENNYSKKTIDLLLDYVNEL